jgi:peptidoglycan/LPS O-acetylase OafA/YrhL
MKIRDLAALYCTEKSKKIGSIFGFASLSDHAKRRATHYSDGLTGLRGFAALWVLVYHTWVASTPRLISIELGSFSVDLTPFFSGGWAGVDILYTLSGFLLTLPFAEAAIKDNDGPRLLPYFYRRVLRVFPAYYFQLAILLILAWAGIAGSFPKTGNLLAHLLIAHNISFEYFTTINGIWWTLPVEFSFYLVLPLLAILLRRRRWPLLLAGAVILSVSYRFVAFQSIIQRSVEYKVWVLEQLPGRIDQFVLGMLTAYFSVRSRRAATSDREPSQRLPPTLYVLVGIAGIVGFLYVLHVNVSRYWEGHFLLYIWHGCASFFIALLIYGIASGSSLGKLFFGGRFIVIVGVVSYSLYLWHLPVIDWVQRWALFVNHKGYLFPVLFLVVLPVSLGAAMLSYLFVERPFLFRETRERTDRHSGETTKDK